MSKIYKITWVEICTYSSYETLPEDYTGKPLDYFQDMMFRTQDLTDYKANIQSVEEIEDEEEE